jgi:hypothetical protein
MGALGRPSADPAGCRDVIADFVSMLEDIKQTWEAIRGKDGPAAGE